MGHLDAIALIISLPGIDFRNFDGYNLLTFGAVAQLGERFNGIEEVRGSIPRRSTKLDYTDLSGEHILRCVRPLCFS